MENHPRMSQITPNSPKSRSIINIIIVYLVTIRKERRKEIDIVVNVIEQ